MAKLSLLPPAEVAELARGLADAGIGVTVLPATDLFLMGRDQDHGVRRGVADANLLLENGVNCSLSTNNVLNPATPYGDCSLMRMANLYANVLQIDGRSKLRACFEMLTERSARLLDTGTMASRSALRRCRDPGGADARTSGGGDCAPGGGVQERGADRALAGTRTAAPLRATHLPIIWLGSQSAICGK